MVSITPRESSLYRGLFCTDISCWNVHAMQVHRTVYLVVCAVSRVANNAFGTAPSSVSILLDDVVCTGSEETLLRCSHLPVGQDNCGHHKDISIRCKHTYVNAGVLPPDTSLQVECVRREM